MAIQQEEKDGRGSFFIMEGDKRVGEMTYSMHHGDKMVIEHTEVDEILRGKHAGNSLVNQAVDYARTHHIKILPLCTFAKKVFDKNKDIQDVLS